MVSVFSFQVLKYIMKFKIGQEYGIKGELDNYTWENPEIVFDT